MKSSAPHALRRGFHAAGALAGLVLAFSPAVALGRRPAPAPVSGAAAVLRGRDAQAGVAGGPLTYRGGPVMHAARIHAIYWAPSEHGFPSGYSALVDAFFRDVAADGGQNANVFASLTQYTDGHGPATDKASYAGALLDSAPYPASGCAAPGGSGAPLGTAPPWGSAASPGASSPGGSVAPPGVSVCLTDAQVQAEIDRLVATGRHARGLGDLYVLFTPKGVGACGYAGGCTYRGYCAYHSWIGARRSPTLYAVIPYADVAGCRGPASPNGNPADQAIDEASHEYSEAVSDPLANAWIDATGNENGDKCLSSFGQALGRTRFGTYDAVIGAGTYELQGEWSNRYRGCVGGLAQVAFTPGLARSLTAVRLHGSSSAGPGGPITAFDWRFGNGTHASGPVVTHRFPHAGVYRVRLTVSAGARSVSTWRTIPVLPRSAQIRLLSRSRRSALAHGLSVQVAGEGAAHLTIMLVQPGRHPLSLLARGIHLDPQRVLTLNLRLAAGERGGLAHLRHPTILAVLSERSGGSAHTTAILR